MKQKGFMYKLRTETAEDAVKLGQLLHRKLEDNEDYINGDIILSIANEEDPPCVYLLICSNIGKNSRLIFEVKR